jgi:hypothetical protein
MTENIETEQPENADSLGVQTQRFVMRCDKCKFWELDYEFTVEYPGNLRNKKHVDEFIGVCHRYPPKIDAVYAGQVQESVGGGSDENDDCWRHPITTGFNWCGEFLSV